MDEFQRHNRKTTRLQSFDYSQEGLYFITVCTFNKECWFGDIENGAMILSKAGEIAQKYWIEIPEHFTNAILHDHIVMPNHVHGIIELANLINVDDTVKRANNYSPLRLRNHINPEFKSPSKTIGSIIRSYKGVVTKWMRDNMPEYFSFDRNLWQRNYHDHIIRNQQSFEKISNYITHNPANWKDDKFYTNVRRGE